MLWRLFIAFFYAPFFTMRHLIRPATILLSSLCKSRRSEITHKFVVCKNDGETRQCQSRPFSAGFCASVLLAKASRSDRKSILSTVPSLDEGVDGERSIDIDKTLGSSSLFPDENTPSLLFGGIPFDQLHICHIKVHKNNTKFSMTNHEGVPLITWTSGSEGFKNAKKGTNIAAQAAAITFSARATERGITTVRVKIGGLGPGRMASIKGLQMGGMNIISISDTTPCSEKPPRPRKQRRL